MQRVVIIGSGLGGLFTGALLAKEGYRVTVLEKNRTIGGGLQTFTRQGMRFETGMHILGGLRPGGSIWRICQYLGINDLQLKDVDADCMDSIVYLCDGKTYRVPEGREAFVSYFSSEFPHEAQHIRSYVDALYDLADEVDMFWLRHGRDYLFAHSEQFLWSADALIDYYIQDERLRDILAYMNPMYGGVAGHTPAYIHALINVLYISGSSRFVGGSQQLADALRDVICQHHGTVSRNAEVVSVHVENHLVKYVEIKHPHSLTAETHHEECRVAGDLFVSAIHPATLVPLCSEGSFPKSYRTRIAEIPNTYSAFTLYIIFKENSFPYINHTCYVQDDYGIVWQHGEYIGDDWPRGLMYMTPADQLDGQEYATKMIINCLMPFAAVEKWKDSCSGLRGEDYKQWKQQHIDKVLDKMERLYPGFRSAIQYVEGASPLTIRDFFHEPGGALYGVQKDCKNILLSQIPIFTKVRNLFLTGQNINLHGICGVPLTAINTVEAIIGENVIIDRLNNQ